MMKFLLIIGMSSFYYSLATIDRIWEIKNRKNLNARAFFVIWNTFRLSYIKELLNTKTIDERRNLLETLVIAKCVEEIDINRVSFNRITASKLALISASAFILTSIASTSTMPQRVTIKEMAQVDEFQDIKEMVF